MRPSTQTPPPTVQAREVAAKAADDAAKAAAKTKAADNAARAAAEARAADEAAKVAAEAKTATKADVAQLQ